MIWFIFKNSYNLFRPSLVKVHKTVLISVLIACFRFNLSLGFNLIKIT